MALILKMAGGGFGGVPNAAQFPASMQVDYVHAYALADGSSVVVHTAPMAPAATLYDAGATSGQVGGPSRRPRDRPVFRCRHARRRSGIERLRLAPHGPTIRAGSALNAGA